MTAAPPPATPPLLKTYQEARLLWEAKDWKLTGVAAELGEKLELKRFHITHTKLSKKSRAGRPSPIEPEVAAAVEVLEEKAGARESKLSNTLEEKAGARENRILQAVAKLGHLTWKHIAIAAGVGGLVVAVSVAASLAPLLARATPPPVQNIFVVGREGGGPALWAEAESYLAMSMWGEKKRPLDQEVPKQTLPRQKVAPCDEGLGQEAIYGNCWAWQGAVKPPCGRLFRHGDKCYAPVGAFSWPADPGPDR